MLAAEAEIESGRPERLILRVDRTDPSKNVVRGFRAYELYLDAHPEMHGRVQMLALLDPSRQDIPEYAEYLGAIQRAARVVNDRFQREGWVPLDLQIQDNFTQAVAAYKQFDVLLVNAIFDGMNLVAKEAPLVNVRDGVLVLSENAGAHDELGEWALTVNPFDVAGQAEAIHEALTMAAGERRRRREAIAARVRELRHRSLDRGPARRPRRGARPARSVNEGLTPPCCQRKVDSVSPEERETLLRRRLHAALQELSADRDPLDLVGDVPIVEEFADDLAQARIADARAAGASWAEISERLGVTRQAAHKRFSGWRTRKRGAGPVLELRFTLDRKGKR